MLRVQAITFFICALLFAGCSGLSTVGPQEEGEALHSNPGQELQLIAGLPPLPQGHTASGTQEDWILGKGTFDRSANAVDDDYKLGLFSGINNPAWGIWHTNPPLKYIDSIEVDVDVIASERIWLAISDFSREAWDIRGPFNSDYTFVPDESRHRSEDGDLYIAAIALGGEQPSVEMLIVNTDDGWVIVTVDSEGDVGEYPSLALVSGRPAISYYDHTNKNLKYAYSSTVTGSQAEDWTCTTVDDAASDVGSYSSLAVVKGQPAISYYDASDEALRYARRMLTIPPAPPAWIHVLVDTDEFGTSVGKYSSLAVVDDRPMISYYDETNEYILHANSLTETGTDPADWVALITDVTGGSEPWCSLAAVDGVGAASYRGIPATELEYRWFPEPSIVTVKSCSSGVNSTSLKLVDGKPAIGFLYSNKLMYAFSTTPHGTAAADWHSFEIDSGYTCRSVSLALIDGRPALSYWNTDETLEIATLVFAWCKTSSGLGSWQVVNAVTIDTFSSTICRFQSLAEVDGKPAVCYYEEDDHDLVYAIRIGK